MLGRMALALYRKYRPVTFEEVIGQEHVTGPLIQALKNNTLNHAYLFSGPRGCGKTSSARILARSLNCAEGPTPSPCGVCESCRALAPGGGGSLDVIEIDAASHGGVDDARELRERAFFAPVNSRFKVYVIDEAHMVSSAGFNALLKLVEEPPDFVKFVFATTEPEKVLQTIRSRTHHYPFRLVPPGVLRAHLEQICAEETAQVESTVFPLVVRAGGGSVRDSLSILDQLLAGSGAEGATYQRAVALLGVTDVALIDDMCDALAAADGAAAFAVIDRVVEAGHDPRRFAADLLERLRDLLILENVPDAATKGLINAPVDQLQRMTTQALRLGTASLSRMADVVHDGLLQMRSTTSARLLLELTCARMLLPAGDEGHAAVLQRLERLERRFDIAEDSSVAGVPQRVVSETSAVSAPKTAMSELAVSGVAPDAPPGVVPSAEDAAPDVPLIEVVAPATDASRPLPELSTEPMAELAPASHDAPSTSDDQPRTTSVGIDDVRRLWPELMERLKQRRLVWSLMQNATPTAVDGSVLTVTVQHQGLVLRIADDTVVSMVRQALKDLLGVDWTIQAQVGAVSVVSSLEEIEVTPAAGPQVSSEQEASAIGAGVQEAGAPQGGVGIRLGGSTSVNAASNNAASTHDDPEAAALSVLHRRLGAREMPGSGN